MFTLQGTSPKIKKQALNLYKYIRPLLFKLDPETAHEIAFGVGRPLAHLAPLCSLLSRQYRVVDNALKTTAFGLDFENPIGVAAGFDKNGLLVPLLASLGFGFMEIGSVSNQPCHGNPKPRLFRLEDEQAIINRMGLNNDGAEVICDRLIAYGRRHNFRLGVNVTKTNQVSNTAADALQDFRLGVEKMLPVAEFIILNMSCPNTADGKTFEDPDSLQALLQELNALKQQQRSVVPVLLKFSPDTPLSQLEAVIAIAERHGANGYVLCNTTASRIALTTHPTALTEIGPGGLSGAPLKKITCERLQFVYRLLSGKKPLIGVGGVFTAEDAYQLIKSGASLIEVYTGMIYEGPSIAKRINLKLLDLLQRDGLKHIEQAVGIDTK